MPSTDAHPERRAFHSFKPDSRFPLHQLAFAGVSDTLEKEIKSRKKDLSSLIGQDDNGWTPLTCAAYKGHLNCFRIIFKLNGIDPIASTRDGFTALHFLAAQSLPEKGKERNMFEKIFKSLLEKTKKMATSFASCPDTPLHVAAESCNEVAVRLILQFKASQQFLDYKNYSLDWTALHIAAKHGNVAIIQLILNAGANMFIESKVIGSVLEVAHCCKQKAAYQILKEHEELAQKTIAMVVNTDLIDIKALKKALLATPTHLSATDSKGMTLLHHLCKQGATAIVQWICEEKRCQDVLDVNIRDKRNWTPLHYASTSPDALNLCSLLMKHGADASRKTPSKSLALHYLTAARPRTKADADVLASVIRAMRSNGVNINTQNLKGYTVLMLSAERGNFPMLFLLLEMADVNVHICNNAGENALMCARRGGSQKCVDKMTAVMAQAPQMALDVARRPASSVHSHMPAEPANVWSLSDALLCDVLSWLRGRDLVVAHCVSRRFARCAAVPTVVRAVALRAGLPAIIPLSYLQHEYGWMTLASMRTAFGGQLPEASVSSMSVCLIGEPSVGRHSFVHCLFGADLQKLPRVQKQASYQCLILLGALPVKLRIFVPSVTTPAESSIDTCAAALSRTIKTVDAVMLCFDSARSSTLDALDAWRAVVDKLRGDNNPILSSYVGMKSDLGVAASVTTSNAIITSARLDRNVHTALQLLLAPRAREVQHDASVQETYGTMRAARRKQQSIHEQEIDNDLAGKFE